MFLRIIEEKNQNKSWTREKYEGSVIGTERAGVAELVDALDSKSIFPLEAVIACFPLKITLNALISEC